MDMMKSNMIQMLLICLNHSVMLLHHQMVGVVLIVNIIHRQILIEIENIGKIEETKNLILYFL
jgi:hypothetical protein